MNAVNAVLFFLVWTFSAVCQADDDIKVSCDDVTRSFGKEVTLTCSVSLLINECCIRNYKFKHNDSKICPQVLPEHSCEQRKSFKCSYTPSTAMTENISFFVQATCGWTTTKFSADKTVYLQQLNPENPSGTSPPETAAGSGFKESVMALSDCEHRKSFTCSYTPDTTMTATFIFFVQSTCGCVKREFPVDITDTSSYFNQEKLGASPRAV
ncbi:uncharacterized protein [Garra rufa]|uniref:uncharacterized protein n=1 Tax=Garra rufa TaxID=137080 RepID=UPI003CCE6700